MPPKTLFRVGLSFLLFATIAYFGTGHWLNTRIFDPLNYPVSLDTRHLQSPPFQINLNERYYVFLRLNDVAGSWNQDYRLDSQWRVYRFGRGPARPRELWASSGEANPQSIYYYAFQASPGQYQLEWDISAAAPDLNSKNPRLIVFTGSSDYEWAIAFAQIFCVFMGGTGLALVVLATARATAREFSRPAAPRMFPDMILRNVVSRAKHAPLQPIHCLPHWGLVCNSVLWIVIFVLNMMMSARSTPHGFFVSVKGRGPVTEVSSPWPDTLVVNVRTSQRFFVNGEEIERDDLRANLLEHLHQRVEWTVYFEADYDTVFMDTTYAIDTIQGCGAKLIWITPKMRQQMATQAR